MCSVCLDSSWLHFYPILKSFYFLSWYLSWCAVMPQCLVQLPWVWVLLLFLSFLKRSFNLSWSYRMLSVISMFWYLLRHAVCPNMWGKFSWASGKNVYSSVFGWNILKTSARSIWFIMLWRPALLCLMFVWMICLLATEVYWSPIMWGQYKISAVLVFLLWTQLSWCLVYICLEVQYPLGGFFL